ncbi:MAG TPA: electron transport complex subunit RsxA [Gammaproteobacteria bacterium]|jgi:electron transport complex protein RnfA|nr:MAG: electron transport complex subunit RsxA [OM182 bacterium]HAL41269.1 electron transport complex subunit RsxA [Gammaproteobacteria bacterium]HBK19290.1 electron transport complex subunit RsxA [Gammaproteobacteria bacterium]|tara:strand:- start:3347 stop:3925 length:579 start_codon:yes stop_codon:yes gene_type:complete
MTDLGLILLGALLINNFVLAQFLGLCPFMGITRSMDTALATGLATTFVLSLAAVLSHLLYHGILVPLDLTYLNILLFIVVIAGVVQLIQVYLRATSPLLHQVLGIYLPLITSNCAVLGVTLLAINQSLTLLETLVFAIGAAAGFTLVMVLFGALREQLEHAPVPAAFRGTPLALISAGLMSLAFMGFQGIGS